jgi:UDP-N-acetylmuramate--alanine ligase
VVAALVRRGHPHVSYEPLERVPARLADVAESGDLVLTLGAGDVWKAGEAFLARAARPRRASRARRRA